MHPARGATLAGLNFGMTLRRHTGRTRAAAPGGARSAACRCARTARNWYPERTGGSRVAIDWRWGICHMGRSDEYRRYVKECLDMANAIQDPKARASLLQMAQVWLRLAQQHNAEQRPDDQPNG